MDISEISLMANAPIASSRQCCREDYVTTFLRMVAGAIGMAVILYIKSIFPIHS
jgi:hypothetical protein